MKRILLIGAYSCSLINFRGSLLETMVAQGNKVFAAASGQDLDTEKKLCDMGVVYCPVRIARVGMNPLADIITLFDLIGLLHRVKPDVILSYAIKPIIYGGFAARLCRVRAIYSLVTGLGYAFMDSQSRRQRLVSWLARFLYSLSLRHSERVFFQNPDDKSLFVARGLIPVNKTVVVNGSGVDLVRFSFVEIKQVNRFSSETIRFLLIARLLKEKGISEYVEAAKMVKRKNPRTEFHLVGSFESHPMGLKQDQIYAWKDEGLIEFHGQQVDVRPFIRECHVYVLPSYYREGTPRTALEAMATGRAVITTDAPGCREIIREPIGVRLEEAEKNIQNFKVGCNGILVPIKNSEALASAMEFFLEHPEQIATMGREGRIYAEKRYDVHQVNAVILREMGLRNEISL